MIRPRLIALLICIPLITPLALFNFLAAIPFSGKFFWLFGSYIFCILPVLSCICLRPHNFSGIKFDQLDLLLLAFECYVILNGLLNHAGILSNDKAICLIVSINTSFALRKWLQLRQTTDPFAPILPVTVILLVTMIASVIAILQKTGLLASYNTSFDVTGTFFHPAPLGGLIVIMLPLLIEYCIFRGVDYLPEQMVRPYSYFCWLALIVICFALPLSHSRAALLGLIGALCWMAWQKRLLHKYIPPVRRSVIVLTFAVLLIAGLLFLISYRPASVHGEAIGMAHIHSLIGMGCFWGPRHPLLLHRVSGPADELFQRSYGQDRSAQICR